MNINKALEEIPSLIARNAEEAEDLRFAWKKAEEELSLKEAKLALQLKAAEHDLTATAIKTMVNGDDDIHRQRLEVLVLESKYRRKECKIKALEEELNSCKMSARLQIAEITNLGFNQKEA